MIELVTKLGLYGVLGIAAVYLFRDVLGPLVRYVVEKKKQTAEARPKADRVTALEVNLSNLTTQVVKLENAMGERATETQNLVEERAIAADNKMDMVLAELKSLREDHHEAHRMLGERIARAEANIENLVRNTPRGRHA